MTASLAALLHHLIDYAGLYPPAGLPLEQAAGDYKRYLASPESWILKRLVLPISALREARLEDNWRVTLLVDDEPGALAPQVETLEIKQPRALSLPTYCEAPLAQISNAFAKFRTGGLTPEAIPSSAQIAGFLREAASRGIPFKATAGLHHPIRSERALTYAPDASRSMMHGFVNVFAAAAFARHGLDRDTVKAVLDEQDAHAFDFREGELRWSGRTLTTEQITAARLDFAHSFGSCSFEEPIADLRALGWMP